ncbi:MAG: GxxExxY protein [Psychrilyobacter sp.]|uniref:GxxExxY protein n=1 Tax=Psychrilyobacter sp. TaxID=2586924 RepID=UPI003C781A4A
MKYEKITFDIIKSFYKIYNTLGHGFLEKVYENSLSLELKKLGYTVESQRAINVYYDNQEVGNYYADLLINDEIILELKVVEKLKDEHKFQLINYLKATDIENRIIIKFWKKSRS